MADPGIIILSAIILGLVLLAWKTLMFIVWNIERTIFFRSVRSYILDTERGRSREE